MSAAMDNNEHLMRIFVDLAKAFDSIDRRILYLRNNAIRNAL